MGSAILNPRIGSVDDSDAYVTLDSRSVILDLPDDGRVSELLPNRSAFVLSRPPSRRPYGTTRAS